MSTGNGAVQYSRLAAAVAGVAMRTAAALQDFLVEAEQDYGLNRDEGMTLLLEANEWAMAQIQVSDPLAHARQLLQERERR